jgi:hypothetical protein
MKININVFNLDFKIIISKISPFVFINKEKNISNVIKLDSIKNSIF